MIAQLAVTIQGFLVRRILSPNLLGVWSLVTVVQGFVATFDLGISAAASRELPLLHGAGDKDEEVKVWSTALWSRTAQGLLLALAVLIYTALSRAKYDRVFLFGMAACAILIFLSSVSESYIVSYQSAQQYVPLSRNMFVYSIVSAALLPAGSLLAGVRGLIVASVCVTALLVFLLVTLQPKESLPVRAVWDWRVLWRLIGFGLPMRLTDYPQSLMVMIDVLWVTKYFGVESLAIYTTAKTIFSMAVEIPSRISNVFLMRLFNLAGAQTSRGQLGRESSRFLFAQCLLVLPCVIIALNELSSWLTQHYLPRYIPSLPVMRILLLSIYFVPQTMLVRNFWILDKRFFSIGISNTVGLTGMLAMFLLMAKARGSTLQMVAVSVLLGKAICYLYVMCTVGVEILGLKGSLALVGHVVAMVCYLYYVTAYPPLADATASILAAGRGLIWEIGRALLLLVPVLCYGAWKTGLVDYLKPRTAE